MSSMLQALYKSRGTADKMRSLRIQRAIKLCYWIKVRQEATVPQSSLKCWRSWAPIEVKLLKIGVVLIKPTTSYFLFLVTFGHNRICGLAVCLLFFRELPALSKTKKKQNPKAVSARDVVLPCQFCWLPPPPPTPHRHAIASAHTYSPAWICAMQRQGGKTCSCHCITWFLPLVFFAANSCVWACTMLKKNTISIALRSSSPLLNLSIPIIPPPRARLYGR